MDWIIIFSPFIYCIVFIYRVHYPLPLTFEETPTVSVYQRLTRRLRRELLTYKSLAGLTESQVGITATGLPNSASNALSTSVAGLQRENTVLRQMLVEQENKERIAQETIRTLEGKIIGLQDTVNAGDTAIEKLRLASRAEVKRLRQEIQEYQQKLGITSGTDNHYSGGGNNSNDSDNNNNNKDLIHQLKDTNEQLKLRIQDLTKQLALSTSSSNKENSSNTNRGRTAARTPTSNNHQLGPQNSTSSLSRRSISNTSRGLSPSGSVQSNRSGSNVHNRLSQASSIYGNTRNPTPTRRTTTTNGTVTPTNNSSTRNRTPTNNNNNNRTPTSVYGTPNSIGNNGPRNGVRSTSNSRTPKSTTGTPSGTNGNVRSSSRSTNPASSASRTTSNNPQRSVTPSGRSVSSQHSQASPSNNNHQRSQISQSSKTRTPTGNRANIASPYLTGVEPILATMERNYKQRNESHNSNSKTTTPIGSRNNGQQQKQQQSTIYGSGNNNSSKGSSSSRGPSPARTIHNGTIHKTSSSSTSTTVVPAPPPAPMMVRNTNTTNTLSVVTEPPVIPRTAWTDTNENIGGSSVNYIQPNGESGSSSRGGSGSGTVSPGGTKYSYDSSAEMHDIDTRLQQLQDFLKAAKSGGPLPNVQI